MSYQNKKKNEKMNEFYEEGDFIFHKNKYSMVKNTYHHNN